MDKIEKIEQEHAIKAKIQRRVKANRIVGCIRFRDHFSSSPGRNSWDLCGHPVYWWKFKAALNCKYLEKIVICTEVEEALEMAKNMSDKFVTIERSIDECREPEWKFVDDLKTPSSRVWIGSKNTSEAIAQKVGFTPTVHVGLDVTHPLETTESLNKLIEKYYEDDLAESVSLVHEVVPFLYTKDPNNPQYLLPVWHFQNLGRRQQYPFLCRFSGTRIRTYRWIGIERLAYVIVPEEEGIEIHNEKDLEKAKFYLKKRLGASEVSE